MNWGEFFAMGGYATYVWGSYAVTFLLLILEVLSLASRVRASRAADEDAAPECDR